MRKGLVIAASSLFFYGLLRDMTLLKTLMLAAAIAGSYLISRLPAKYLEGAKYPIVGLCLALPIALVFYPPLKGMAVVGPGALILAFYGIALFLVTLDEKGKKHYKEVTGLCLLYAAAFASLYLTGFSELVLPLSVAMLLFLFIANKVRMMPFVAGLTVAAVVFLLIAGTKLFATGPFLGSIERYVLMGAAFALTLIGFVKFVKKPDFVTILGFFGLLYVSVDLLLSVGLHLKGILLQQPALSLLIVGPIMGIAMKEGRERS